MPEFDARAFSAMLLEKGVAPRHARRISLELRDHFEDLRDEALRDGQRGEQAVETALQRLGDTTEIAGMVAGAPHLRCWVYRYPALARAYLPVAYVLLLPAAPLFAGAAHAGSVVRWGAALALGAGVTATMLLCMQLAIVLT